MTNSFKKILVIRLGALGDFVQSFYPFAAIRQAHPQAEITLLTTSPFVGLARKSPWFDSVIVDDRPSWFDLPALWRLRNKIRGFDYIYDLQTSSRSVRYCKLAGQSQGSGMAHFLSHVHDNPHRNGMHTIDRQRDQLQRAGIRFFPEPDLDWLVSGNGVSRFSRPYVILVPGCSLKRVKKRWPVENYAEFAQLCVQRNLLPVVIGSKSETMLASEILQACPEAVSLVGKTDLLQLGGLLRYAEFSLGNDTGPMHIAAMVGCSCYVLFSSESDPALTAPRGKQVHVIVQKDLRHLSVKKVAQELNWVH